MQKYRGENSIGIVQSARITHCRISGGYARRREREEAERKGEREKERERVREKEGGGRYTERKRKGQKNGNNKRFNKAVYRSY